MTVRLIQDGVEVSYEFDQAGQKTRANGTFGPKVREELLKAWGATSFDLETWPSETTCLTHDLRWVLQAAGKRRVLCESREHLGRLNDFRQALRLLVQSSTAFYPPR
ncbi:MAG: hypothetical protein IT285_14920 [Bdellovibrionales bacterium]|nr:hypothetical protein [Bdellovibrionales bacterium]